MAYFVAGHILSMSPAKVYVNVHDRYCRRQQYMATFTANIVTGDSVCQRPRHIFSLATIYVNVHGKYFRWKQYMSTFTTQIFAGNNICQHSRHQYMSTFTAHIFAGNNICQRSRHIFSPAPMYAWFYGTDCRPSAHIVAGDDICRNSCVCLLGGKRRQTDKLTDGQTDRLTDRADFQ